MKIETKYNIGDEVWLRYGDKIKKGEVIDLKATVVFLSSKPAITYSVRVKKEEGGFWLNRDKTIKVLPLYEEMFFPTKEELLKSL
jgi:hypothetical protein